MNALCAPVRSTSRATCCRWLRILPWEKSSIARTLETQVSHLLSHTHAEVRRLGELLKKAALEPAYNVNHDSQRELVEKIREVNAELGERAARELLKDVRVAPTLVKYADPNAYEMETRRELRQAAAEFMKGAAIAKAELVELLEDDPIEIELAATLLTNIATTRTVRFARL